jgi:biotin-dependent carboxylase-like uncharacterized protein
MGEAVFQVIEPGIFTTIQDLGRRGYFASGIPPAGAMDRFALRMVEITALGMKVEVVKAAVIALTGADFDAKLNGTRVPPWQTVEVHKGDTLSLSGAKTGWRGYLCVAGGIDVPHVLGSKSTYTMGGLGGVRGRKLKKGDLLEAGPARVPLESLKGRRVKEDVLPKPGAERELRIVLGPQDDHVKKDSIEVFLNTPYRVSANSNRVGYRFEGPQLFFEEREASKDAGSDPSNIVDDGNAIGAIQIPGGTEPICLGPDGVTMGGYVKIASDGTSEAERLCAVSKRYRG